MTALSGSAQFELKNYQITSIAGRGAVGIVYKAVDTTIQQVVAIKTIGKDFPELIEQDAVASTVSERFRREVLAGRRLKHDNIVRIFEYGETEDRYYIVMEFVHGRSLNDYFNGGREFSRDEIFDFMAQILDALGYAHTQGVIHRDIKPGNILLNEHHILQISDFGVAKIFDTGGATLTGSAVGTPGYMAPEQWDESRPPDARVDLFSTGIILYQFLTRRHPFRGDSTAETIDRICSVEPLPPSDLIPGLPTEFDQIIQRALQKDPELRYQTAEEFANDLRQVRKRMRTLPEYASQSHGNSRGRSLLVLGSAALGLALSWFLATTLIGKHPADAENNARVAAGTTPDSGIARRLQEIAKGLSCAHLEVSIFPSGEYGLRGFVAPEERDRLKQALVNAAELTKLPTEIRDMAWPYCELLDVLFPYKRGNKWEFADERNTRKYIEGDPLAMVLTAPNYKSYLYVDYYQLDGGVMHLFPLHPEDMRLHEPNAQISIGNTADGGHEWHIQAPFGMEMIVVMASTEPLFTLQRPELEHAKDYLEAIRATFVDGTKRKITADYYFIQSRAKRATP